MQEERALLNQLHAPQLVQIYEDRSLRIQYLPGRSRVLAISMSSVGREGRVFQPPEFYGSCSQGGENHVIFVSDRRRSWLNQPGMLEHIEGAVSTIVACNDIERIVTLGFSMGASMALTLSRFMPVNTCLAIAPQYSVNPELMPDEARWRKFSTRIADWRFPHVELPKRSCRAFLLHGGDDKELYQMKCFPDADNLAHFVFPKYGHRLPIKLKQKGMLSDIIRYAVEGRPNKLRQAIYASGGIPRDAYYQQTNALRDTTSAEERTIDDL